MLSRIKTICLASIVLYLFNCSNNGAAKTSQTVEFHFEDINHFWNAYELTKTVDTHAKRTAIVQDLYINKSSKGLKLLIDKYKLNAADYATFMKDTVFFNSIKPITLDIQNDTLDIRKHLKSFETYYPDAIFNDIYFVIGQFKRAGTVIDSTMIIQLEKNARSETTESAFFF